MQVLTPSGYVDASTLQVGDSVCAFDENTGAPIVNQVESVAYVDLAEWQRWWKPAVDSGELTDYPPFAFYKINGTWTLNSEQSIWRNGTNVCHVRDLVVGDVVYDDADHDVPVTSIETFTDAGWYRFDISGDHSYIVNGLTVHNASRFWVSGTGTWDLSTTTHWGSASGVVNNSSAPGSADIVTFDGSSGGGTVTPSYGGVGTFQSITCGAFTGTIAWNTNNESVTLSAAGGFSYSGSGTRTINMGSGTWTFTGVGSSLIFGGTTTGLTFTSANATLIFTATNSGSRGINVAAGATFGSTTISANTGGGPFNLNGGSTSVTYTTLSIVGPNFMWLPSGASVITVTNALNISGSTSAQIGFGSVSTSAVQATISSANNGAFSYCAFRDIKFQGGGTFTATSSFDLGNNSGITITAPSAGGPVGQFISHQRGTPY